MPITAELENVRKLESVGFTHGQAVVIAQVQEDTAQDAVRDLKEFIRSEISALELRIKASQTDLLVKILGIVFGCSSLAVAVLKLIL